MNEVLTLLAVLLLIYFLECLSLVPEEIFVFRVRGLRRWHAGKSLARLERQRTRVYLSSPFPGWGDIAICGAEPVPNPKDRTGIELEFSKMLDTRAARRRMRAYRRVLRPLYWDSYLLFAVIFVIFPLVALRLGLWIALPIVPAFLLGVVHMVFAFRRVHRAFHPDSAAERRERTIGLLLSPLGAIRVPGLLLRNSMAGFHPLAVAAAALPAVEARRVASRLLRQLQFRSGEPVGLAAGARSNADAWHTAVWEWIAEEFGNPESLLGAPAKSYRDSVTYCPRCEQEYLLATGECSDCPGVALQPFPAPTAPAPARTRRRRGRR